MRPLYEGVTMKLKETTPHLTSSGKIGVTPLAQGATFRSVFGKHVFENKDAAGSMKLGIMLFDKVTESRSRGSLLYTLSALIYSSSCVCEGRRQHVLRTSDEECQTESMPC